MDPTQGIEANHSFSILGLLHHADPVVQAVIAILLCCSVACWALILEKFIRLVRLQARVRELETVASSPGMVNFRQGSLAGLLWAAAGQEDRIEGASRGDYQQRLERAMRLRLKVELRRAEGGCRF